MLCDGTHELQVSTQQDSVVTRLRQSLLLKCTVHFRRLRWVLLQLFACAHAWFQPYTSLIRVCNSSPGASYMAYMPYCHVRSWSCDQLSICCLLVCFLSLAAFWHWAAVDPQSTEQVDCQQLACNPGGNTQQWRPRATLQQLTQQDKQPQGCPRRLLDQLPQAVRQSH